MLTIYYIPKIQALDKALALHIILAAEFPAIKSHFIFNIDQKNRAESCRPLLELIADENIPATVTDSSFLKDEIIDVWKTRDIDYSVVQHQENAGTIDLPDIDAMLAQHAQQTLFILPKTEDFDGLNNILMRHFSAQKIPVLAYFKSVHDAGYGLTAHDDQNHLRTCFLACKQAIKKRIPSFMKRQDSFDDGYVDAFLCFNEAQKTTLQNRGYNKKQLYVIGYPLLYKRWLHYIKKQAGRQNAETKDKIIVVFTRGQTPGRPAEQNIISDDYLQELLSDILNVCDDSFESATIYIKPHPIQDIDTIKKFVADNQSRSPSIVITHDPPALLSARAHYVIATYSSTVIDSLAYGVPTIEYFQENAFFRAKHPAGSPFPELGALKARTKEELATHLHALENGYRPDNILQKKLVHQEDIYIFKKLLNG